MNNGLAGNRDFDKCDFCERFANYRISDRDQAIIIDCCAGCKEKAKEKFDSLSGYDKIKK